MNNNIRISNIEYIKDKRKIIKKTNLIIKFGELVAILGKSGAGKSTLISIINGTIKPTKGHVYFDDKDISLLSKDEKNNIGIFWQDLKLIEDFTVIQNINCGALGRNNFFYAIGNILNIISNINSINCMEKCNLDNSIRNSLLSSLSGGQVQRVAIARLLNQNAKTIFADEPFSNLDPELSKKMLSRLIPNNNNQINTAVISIHQTNLIKYFSRVIALDNGSIILDKKTNDLKHDDIKNIYL